MNPLMAIMGEHGFRGRPSGHYARLYTGSLGRRTDTANTLRHVRQFLAWQCLDSQRSYYLASYP